tara:strand:+ start:11900 stop:12358 length:459 start_codon:yes stop_codon:yes gene_type:complete
MRAVFIGMSYFVITLSIYSCKNDDSPPNCGCDSATLSTIPNKEILEVPLEEQKSGLLFYKTSEKVDGFYDEEQYNNRFWIVQEKQPCLSCQRNFIVCNENLLGKEYDYLKQQNVNDSIEVKFTGKLKSLCIPKILLVTQDYKEIVLTSIQKQ